MESRVFLVGVIVGILATVTMDVVAMVALRLGIAGRGPRRTGPDLIGRWVGYLFQGKLRHTDILQTPPLRGELLLGLAAHYSIGIVLTLVYLGLLIMTHATPTAFRAILYGTATTVFPWFIMFPSQGMGWLGRDAPGNGHLARISLVNHIIFGVGLAVWTAVMSPI
ncbi:MAG TPA: DUF2938 family protein [Candidatus Udaeobacter sp.]|jgi:hypothetical protein|nr:DUF2938 family protein [Candidatus Udaeobacter sp.]